MQASLKDLLKSRFGFDSFRPHQEAVCQALLSGSDALLVMPTGAGKSLCYQLPALARGGTALVISPLVALMEDQVQKLQSLGLKAERIHSGRERSESRAVLEAYLRGELDFLFVAPERLALPAFPQMLAKKALSLIAIDEAHCISQWGHDFRPEYRMLGARLPMLRAGPNGSAPCPIIALTATATPAVQKDIMEQLSLGHTQAFIHGFRRDNIAVTVRELSQGERIELVRETLKDPARLPAIVYASTRKNAEAIAADLSRDFKISLYHGGMRKETRDENQKTFLTGASDIMVATIAFGMGIDKANVRTVLHAALPSSLEAYYQEIGRAGRDGLPSMAILAWSYADRKMHEFLHTKNYPEASVLRSIFEAVQGQAELKDSLALKLGLDADLFEAALEKLWIHGGVLIDGDEMLSAGKPGWLQTYQKQRQHRLEQIGLMSSFAERDRCRMLGLVQHFGDQFDSGAGCGHCDICAPDLSGAYAPEGSELAVLERVVQVIRRVEGRSTGRLHRDHFAQLDRKRFEHFLAALSKAEFIYLEDSSFDKDGQTIRYRAAYPGPAVHRAANNLSFALATQVTLQAAPNAKKSVRGKTIRRSTITQSAPTQSDPHLPDRVAALKLWRLNLARAKKIPAFRILSDRTLIEIATFKPGDLDSLQSVKGMGPKLVEKLGNEILKTLAASH